MPTPEVCYLWEEELRNLDAKSQSSEQCVHVQAVCKVDRDQQCPAEEEGEQVGSVAEAERAFQNECELAQCSHQLVALRCHPVRSSDRHSHLMFL